MKLCIKMSTLTSVIADKHSVARRLRGATGGLSIRTHGEATTGRRHLDYKIRVCEDKPGVLDLSKVTLS